MSLPTVKSIIERFEQFAPPHLAEDWDKIGLHIGSYTQVVGKVLVSLELVPEVVDEAIAGDYELIIVHHPAIFSPLTHLVDADYRAQMFMRLIQHGISVYVAHTNLDSASGGMNDWVAERLGLVAVEPLALPSGTGEQSQLGRFGRLPAPMSLAAFAEQVKQVFQLPAVHLITAEPEQQVTTVALIAGGAAKEYPLAQARQADVYVTGDVTYHTAVDMLTQGVNCVDPGHAIEAICQEKLVALLNDWAAEQGWTITAHATQVNHQPFRVM